MVLHLLQYSDVENAFDEPGRVARLAGGIRARRASVAGGGDAVLVVGTGDVFAPGVLSLETRGEHALSFFEAVGPVAETLGNHDFDHGVERTRELVGAAPHPFVVANAYEGAGADAPRFGGGATVPWTTVDAGGCTVGFVGVVHPETGTMAPGAEGVAFRDPEPAAREAVAAVREAGADVVVVLAHLGEPLGEDLAAALDVAVVFDGHRHEAHVARFDGTQYARPGNGARRFVHATVDSDANAAVAGAEATAADGGTPSLVETADAPVHEPLRAALEDEFAAAGLTETVAHVDDPIDCGEVATNVGESRVGNLVTDAYRWATDADVALMTPGGIRTRDDLSGAVTAGDLAGLVPFDDALVTCRVDGGTLRALLERTTRHRMDGPHRKFGHVSGGRVVWDDVEREFRSVTVNGAPLDPEDSYRLASTDYYVETDHIYPELSAESVVRRHGPQYESIVAYARERGVAPACEGRIERPTMAAVDHVPFE